MKMIIIKKKKTQNLKERKIKRKNVLDGVNEDST